MRAGISKYRNCSVARTLDIIEDGWTFLLIREQLFGVHKFEELQNNLRISRATLTARLKRLVEEGIFKKTPYSAGGTRYEYRFTRKGAELYPVMLALLKWGDDWLLGKNETPPVALFHKKCGHWITPRIVCSACNEDIQVQDATYTDGSGAGWSADPVLKQNRKTKKPLGRRLDKGCSVGRSLDIIGDRWTFMVMRETFFGTRKYDDFEKRLGISSNILADRLKKLVEAGLLRKEKYGKTHNRYAYRQTEMGADLYGAYLAMIAWADQWEAGPDGPPLLLHHKNCGKVFSAKVVCSHCNEVLNTWDVGGTGF